MSDKTKIRAYPNSSGSSIWRLIDPFAEINKRDLGYEMSVSTNGVEPDEKNVLDQDAVILQSIVDKKGIAMLYAYQQERGLKIIVDCDDFIELNPDNPFTKEHEVTGAKDTILKTMEIADAITTTTPYLAEKLKEYNDNVYVLPNLMSKKRWDMGKPKQTNNKITRIGYFGSMTHLKDLEVVSKALRKVLVSRDVELVTLGDPRFKRYFVGLNNVQYMLGVPMENYPSKLYGLGLDFAIAPLADNEFNRCKSAIKTYEAGIVGIPIIASDVEPYKDIGNKKVGVFLADTLEKWEESIEYLIDYPEDRQYYGDRLRSYILNNKMLDDVNVGKYINIYERILNE